MSLAGLMHLALISMRLRLVACDCDQALLIEPFKYGQTARA